uniref:Lactamase, beta n=1 Tax=Callorhinchus milii TaxID=7868 RepID=A0A4W3HXR1_CALMI
MRIASISKSLSMAAIAKLWEEGKLDLDAPVQKYVPEFPEKEYEGEKVTITTRLLVSHLSGIRHYEKDVNKIKEQKEKRNNEGGTKSEIKENEGKSLQKKEFEHEEYYMKERFENVTKSLKLFQDDPLVFSPGTQFLYSTHGWTLLSAVVERVAGQNFLEFMKKLFRDIGMLRTVPEEHEPIIYNRSRYYFYNKKGYLINCPYVDNSYKWAGGGFLSTVQDLLKFGNAMLYSYQSKHFQKGDHRHLPGYLKPETIKMLWTPVEKTELAWDKDGTYAMGWGVIEQKQKYGQCRQQHHYLTHTGGAVGASSVLLVLPEDIYTAALPEEAAVPPRGIVVTILCNMQSASLNSTALQIALEFYKVKTNKNHNI